MVKKMKNKNAPRKAPRQSRTNVYVETAAPRARPARARKAAVGGRVPNQLNPLSATIANPKGIALQQLARTSPCAFLQGFEKGEYTLNAARDPHTAVNSSVQQLSGPLTFTCDGNGAALVYFTPTPLGAIRNVLNDTPAADLISPLPQGAAFATSMAMYRCIAMEVHYEPTMSALLNQGTVQVAALDPAGTQFDYIGEGLPTKFQRIDAVMNIAKTRAPISYDTAPAKQMNMAVVSPTDFFGTAIVDGVNQTVRGPGMAFVDPQMLANASIGAETAPITKTLRAGDLLPTIVLGIKGAAPGAPYTIRVCAIFEGQATSNFITSQPASSGGSAGVASVATKVAHIASAVHLGSLERGGERVLEGVARVAGYAGVPGAGAAADVMHGAQSALNKAEHWLGWS